MKEGDIGKLCQMHEARDLEGKLAKVLQVFKPGDVMERAAGGSFICWGYGYKVLAETGDVIAIWTNQINPAMIPSLPPILLR